MNLILYLALTVFVVCLDLLTKHFAKISETLASGSIDIIPGVFRFTYVENPGAAMGSFANNRWVFMVLSTVALAAIVVFVWRNRATLSRLLGVALSLIVGGGIGNMYERLFNQNAAGQYVVTDFLDFYLFPFWKWIFNLADVAVCVGAGLVLIHLVIELVQEYRYKKNPAAYDELLAADRLDPDGEQTGELAALDGVSPVEPYAVEEGTPLEKTGEDADVADAEKDRSEDTGEDIEEAEDSEDSDGADTGDPDWL